MTVAHVRDFDTVRMGRALRACWSIAPDAPDRPALHKAVTVEWFDHGIRLLATDSCALIACWVGDKMDEPEPDIGELPSATAVINDNDGVLLKVCAHAVRDAEALLKDANEVAKLTLTIRVNEAPPSNQLAFDGLGTSTATIEYGRVIKGTADVYEGQPVTWRQLAGMKAASTDTIALNASVLGAVVAAAKLCGGIIRFDPSGRTGIIRWAVDPQKTGDDHEGLLYDRARTWGYLMPVRLMEDMRTPGVENHTTESDIDIDDLTDSGPADDETPTVVDDLFDRARTLVTTHSNASQRWLARELDVSYFRAGRLLDQLETVGVVGPSTGGKREVLVGP